VLVSLYRSAPTQGSRPAQAAWKVADDRRPARRADRKGAWKGATPAAPGTPLIDSIRVWGPPGMRPKE